MIARNLNDLQVYQKSQQAARAVSTLLKQPGLRRDCKLSQQLGDASDSTACNIAEGFGQQTDRKFAQYLYIARGSANEVRAHLIVARDRNYITNEQLAETDRIYNEIGKMLTRFIQYLQRSDRRQRG